MKRQADPFKDSNEWYTRTKYCVQLCRDYYRAKPLNRHDWEDISQDVALHVWQKRRMFRKGGAFYPWVSKVVCRKLCNVIRDRFRGSIPTPIEVKPNGTDS